MSKRSDQQEETSDGNTKITLYVDIDVLAAFRIKAERERKSFQDLMDVVLREAISSDRPPPLTVENARQIIREELKASGRLGELSNSHEA